MNLQKFRRFPARELERSCGRLGGQIGWLYHLLDRGGRISDAIADPWSAALRLIPKPIIRWSCHRGRGPLVSVIVATRNNERTIGKSLKSLLDQTHRNIEVIVIDDASDDDSLKIINDIARRDLRVSVIQNPRQLGTGRSRNLGLRAARGDYVTFHDGDDLSLPTRVAVQLAALTKSPGKKMSVCNYVRVDSMGRALEINGRRVMKCIISMMFPRNEVLERVGYFEKCSVSEDSDLYERIKIEFGASCEILVFRTLYEALFRPQSSFFSDVKIESFDGAAVRFFRNEASLNALAGINERHQLMREGKMQVFVGCDN
ncbi:glycosyltransferase family A protein [Sinorhizobium medicae]|uniref:glycosyltransferase family 2 protein n=1 Tax=Sinorhizobium medicae TaxID=110321 RepID=UPI002AF6A821|nr:glycosyltransferase family A protein [Sinorhizobium medicae]WQO47238.1 glycosyltransferase family A protein [Sinorhizobium medicae]WQO67434.1 glycosyltransferase family A protein [Sinorhizobium medicae]WQO74598.1 glycosyltransferase family A protein [Sinorhizobium medicae]WQO90514.1 glycosyltransferase family A protein [Sinorhizobium medicae]